MSAPNKDYDPVEVSALDPAAIAAAQALAEAAVARASDLADLKQVRIDHAGDRSALALANREIGALPPAAKAEAGKPQAHLPPVEHPLRMAGVGIGDGESTIFVERRFGQFPIC